MAESMITNGMFLSVFILFHHMQDSLTARCNTGYTYYNKYTYCVYGCCSSLITNYKCCHTYYSTYYSASIGFGLSTGTIAGIVISSLVGIGILITLVVCCACSKGRHGRVIRTGVTMGTNVTVVSSNMGEDATKHICSNRRDHDAASDGTNESLSPPAEKIENRSFELTAHSMPQNVHPNQYNQSVPIYSTQPLQPMQHPIAPPSYAQVTNQMYHNVPGQPNVPPPAYMYQNPEAPQQNPVYPPQGQAPNVINVSPNPNGFGNAT